MNKEKFLQKLKDRLSFFKSSLARFLEHRDYSQAAMMQSNIFMLEGYIEEIELGIFDKEVTP